MYFWLWETATYTVEFCLSPASCVSLRTVVLADVLGVSKLTKAFGIVAFLQGVAFTVGPPISGELLTDKIHNPPQGRCVSIY